MTSLQRVACLIGSAAALVLLASGCDPYTYFNVDITIDHTTISDPTLQQVGSCKVYVLEGNRQIERGQELKDVRTGFYVCKAPDTGKDENKNYTYNVGTMDYSTARSSGTINFVVNMIEVDETTIAAQGSAQGNVNPGQVLTVELVAKGCPCPDTTQYSD